MWISICLYPSVTFQMGCLCPAPPVAALRSSLLVWGWVFPKSLLGTGGLAAGCRSRVQGEVITVSLLFSICRVSQCHSNSLNPVKRLQLTLTGFAQLWIILFGFLLPRLREAIKTIVSCSPSTRCPREKNQPKLHVYIQSMCVLAHVGKQNPPSAGALQVQGMIPPKPQDNANYIVIKGQSEWLAVLRSG